MRLLHAVVVLVCVSTALAADLPRGDWVGQGFRAEGQATLRKYLWDSVVRKDVAGGSLLLVHKGKVIFEQGFGHAALAKKRAFAADAPCAIASLSKSLIATLLAKLASDKRLDLDKPIDAFMPVLKKLTLANGKRPKRAPTLRECLRHTAGFIADRDPGGRPWVRLRGKGLTLAQVVEREAKLPLASEPGTRFAYSGIGYDVAGRVAEVVMGKDLEALLQEHLCKPLGMTRTTMYPDAARRAAMPRGYWRTPSDTRFRPQRPRPALKRGDYKAVGGGIVSTPRDLARFMLLHQDEGMADGKPLIAKGVIQQLYKRRPPSRGYGMGFMVVASKQKGDAPWILHTGSSGTLFWLHPDRQIIGVLLTQSTVRAPRSTPRTRPAPWLKTAKQQIDACLKP